jgi:hypothetical protein
MTGSDANLTKKYRGLLPWDFKNFFFLNNDNNKIFERNFSFPPPSAPRNVMPHAIYDLWTDGS